jgi:transcriptional regulator with XRE-family HTH domain
MSMPDSADPALACALRRLRHAQGATQEAVAHNAGITVAALARIERGQASPRWTTVRRIVGAGLDRSLTELVAAVENAQMLGGTRTGPGNEARIEESAA